MKRILRSRLPERFADKLPPPVVELAIGIAMPLALTLVRLAVMPWTADRAPYALVFVAVVGASVLAGWRSGIIAIIVGQILAWWLVVQPVGAPVQNMHLLGGLGLATASQLVAVVIVWLYQREVDRAWSKQAEQVDLLHLALKEIDHRTANNYQTVLALVLAQARRADLPIKDALQQVADRIKAIAMASRQLALSSNSLDKVRVASHLSELCDELRQGLSRPGVTLHCEFEDVQLTADDTTWLSIIINELVTNALKHAFPDDRHGEIHVSLGEVGGALRLIVADNGVGIRRNERTRGTGLGSRLVQTFAKQLGAKHVTETGHNGTRHQIDFPRSD